MDKEYSKYIFLCRHGYRDDINCRYKYNPNLTKEGKAQSILLGRYLKKYTFDYFFSSPYLRALETSYEISKIIKKKSKVEYGLGEWLYKEWMSEYPEIWDEKDILEKFDNQIGVSNNSKCEYRFPENDERLDERCKRVTEWLKTLDGNTLCISHGVVIRKIVSFLSGNPYENIECDICSVSGLGYDSEKKTWDILINGSTNHMKRRLGNINTLMSIYQKNEMLENA